MSEKEHGSSPNGCHPDCPACAKEQGDPVADLVAILEAEGIKSEHLDQAVHDAASERATLINNEGLTAQVQFLLKGSDLSWKPGDILYVARRELADV